MCLAIAAGRCFLAGKALKAVYGIMEMAAKIWLMWTNCRSKICPSSEAVLL